MNRFPFPPEGELPLGPIELLSYIVHMETPMLKDEASQGVKWTRAIQDFVKIWSVPVPSHARPFFSLAEMNHRWIPVS